MNTYIFGLQRSGTNLVQLFCNEQLGVHFANGPYKRCWKHGPPRSHCFVPELSRSLVCVRHPVEWLHASYRYFEQNVGDWSSPPEFHRGMSFLSYISTPSYSFDTPIIRWNSINRLYAELPNAHFTTLDRLHNDQLGAFADIAAHLDHPSARVEPIVSRINNCTERTGPFKASDYPRLTPAEYSLVTEQLDTQVYETVMGRPFNPTT